MTGLHLLSVCDLAGRPDSLQIMLWQRHAFVTHPFAGGFSVVDVRDPRQPKPVAYVPPPPGTRTLHLQLSDGILLVTNEADDSASANYLDKEQYFGTQLGDNIEANGEFSAGVRVYDVSRPSRPAEVGFLPIPGYGAHRLWWAGGPLATASALPTGASDFLLCVLDLSDPVAPRLVGQWSPDPAPPTADSAAADSAGAGRIGLHHAILDGTLAYGAWRGGGLQIVETAGGRLRLVGALPPDAWGGGNTHTALPLPGRDLVLLADESVQDHQADGVRRIWLIDVADRAAPRVLGPLPEPAEQDFGALGGIFGPHNLHENRPGTWQSEDIVFATYQNAGIRVYDISDSKAPAEIAYLVPPGPARNVDPRASSALAPQSSDLLVTADGIVFASDLNAGLSLMQFEGT
jgi:hypothetical protein